MLQVKLQHQLKQTLIHINIEDTKAKIYAIQGPSGIGKTTILNINQMRLISILIIIY